MSDRTKKLKSLKNLFFSLSLICWLGTVIFVVISVFSRVGEGGNVTDIFSDDIREKLIAFGTTAIIGTIVALFIKEKIRTALYMISLIIIVIMHGEVGMYVVLSIWGIDEYVFSNLYKNFKQKYIINKEIDKR